MTINALDRSAPPVAGPLADFHPPRFRRTRLVNGLELVLAPRDGVPLIELMLLLPAGGELNPLDRAGLAALTVALIDEGTQHRTGLEIAIHLERLGAVLGTNCDWDAARIEASALEEHLPELLRVVAEVAREPSFPAAEVERLRRQTLAEILRRPDHPPRLADRALAAALYPRTPFAELLPGSQASVEAISRDELVAFHAAHYRPAPAQLVLCGSFDEKRASEDAERLFADWQAPALPAGPETSPVALAETTTVTVVDLPRAPQTELRVGHIGVPRTHRDRTRLGVLNAILGGKFTSRLNLNLRERHGFTYGVSSRFVDRRSAGPFVVATSVANDVAAAALCETLTELRRIRDQPVSATELEETRSYLRGVFPYTFQTVSGHIARLADLAQFGLPDDYFETALREVATTTVEDIHRLAGAHLRPETAAIVAVGPASALTPQLEGFGDVRVVTAE